MWTSDELFDVNIITWTITDDQYLSANFRKTKFSSLAIKSELGCLIFFFSVNSTISPNYLHFVPICVFWCIQFNFTNKPCVFKSSHDPPLWPARGVPTPRFGTAGTQLLFGRVKTTFSNKNPLNLQSMWTEIKYFLDFARICTILFLLLKWNRSASCPEINSNHHLFWHSVDNIFSFCAAVTLIYLPCGYSSTVPR